MARDLVITGVAPGEFLVRGEGTQDEIRQGIEKLLPGVKFQLAPVDDKCAQELENRISKVSFSPFQGIRASNISRNNTYRMNVQGRIDPATLGFNPQATAVQKVLPGGVGPVGVTVGVGIAGKF